MKINHFIPLAKPDISDEEINEVSSTIQSGWLTTGPKVAEFEMEFSNYLTGNEPLHTLALNSCTSALFLTLIALGIKKEDEVIVPTWTFASTAHVVEWIGAKVVLCDVEEASYNIDITKIESLITEKTKAIIPVHIAGYPCDLKAIQTIAQKYNLKVIEDAAHAIGTKYYKSKIGNYSDATCFSFYATKNLAMGEGGAVVSKNKQLIEKMQKLSYLGINKEAFKRYDKKGTWFYDIEELGYKCNLDSIHASIGLVQLKKIDTMNNRRRDIAKYYREHLSPKLILPYDSNEHHHTYHLFQIRLPKNFSRDEFMLYLKEHNIGSSVHFRPLHLHPHYKEKDDYFDVANKLFKTSVSIPMYSAMNDNEVHYVTTIINQWVNNHENIS